MRALAVAALLLAGCSGCSGVRANLYEKSAQGVYVCTGAPASELDCISFETFLEAAQAKSAGKSAKEL